MALTLLFGDCIEVMATLPSQSVDMVLCDLPYGTTRCRWDIPISLPDLWREYDRVCRGPVVLFAQSPFDKVLGVSNLSNLRYEWIWEKGNATGHLNAKYAPLKAHENILVFYKKLPIYNPIKTFGHVRKVSNKQKIYSSDVYGQQNTAGLYDSTERFPRSVIKFSSDKQKSKLHPTQKPLALVSYLIRTYTNPGFLVLDNCMGSGTTGLACRDLGRDFIGIENDLDVMQIARKRLLLC